MPNWCPVGNVGIAMKLAIASSITVRWHTAFAAVSVVPSVLKCGAWHSEYISESWCGKLGNGMHHLFHPFPPLKNNDNMFGA